MSMSIAEDIVITTLVEAVASDWEKWQGEVWFADLKADNIAYLGLGEDAWKSLKTDYPASSDPVMSVFLAEVRRLDPSRTFYIRFGEMLHQKYNDTH